MVVRGSWISPHEKAERGGRTRSAKWTLVASVFMPSAVDGTVVATVPTDSCPQERPSLSAIGRRRQASGSRREAGGWGEMGTVSPGRVPATAAALYGRFAPPDDDEDDDIAVGLFDDREPRRVCS